MYVKFGPNIGALAWAVTGAAIAAAVVSAGALAVPAAAATAALAGSTMALTGAGATVAMEAMGDTSKAHGYGVIQPGGTYTSEKMTLSLLLQANIVLKGVQGARRAVMSCWTGLTNDSQETGMGRKVG